MALSSVRKEIGKEIGAVGGSSMKKRLFVAINLPEEIKDRIKGIIREIQPLFGSSTSLTVNPERSRRIDGEIRFLKPETWHITITFLGYQPDDAIPAIIDSIKSIVQNHTGDLRINFDRISFGPLGKQPRMIWLVAANETSKNLALLKNKLEDELIKNNVQFQREKRGLGAAHITLARFSPITQITRGSKILDQRAIRGSLTDLRESALTFQAQSLDLMESHLKRTGAEYEALFKVDFKK